MPRRVTGRPSREGLWPLRRFQDTRLRVWEAPPPPPPLPAWKSTSLWALGQGQGCDPRAGQQTLSTSRLSQGKQKYTLPLYHAMMAGSAAAQTLAKETFAATAPQLHGNVAHYVQQIVEPLGR